MKRAEWQAHHSFDAEDMERIGWALEFGGPIVAVLDRPPRPGSFVLRNSLWVFEDL